MASLGLFLALCVSGTLGAKILESPPVTNFGDWGPWEHCLAGEYAVGFQLKTESWLGPLLDDTAINGIRLLCGKPGDEAYGGSHPVSSSVGQWGTWGAIFGCRGLVNGFQFRSEAAGQIDCSAANNMRAFCSASDNFVEGDGERFGTWTTPQHCETKQALCGIQSQLQPWQNERDDTSLNNMRTECCDVEDPAITCSPTDNLKFLIRCDNSLGSTPLNCVYTHKFGLSYAEVDSVTEAYESLGFKLEEAGYELKNNYGTNFPISPVTGYDWTNAPAGTWISETSGQGNVEVAPGDITEVYQIVGTCGIYSPATNGFKEVIAN